MNPSFVGVWREETLGEVCQSKSYKKEREQRNEQVVTLRQNSEMYISTSPALAFCDGGNRLNDFGKRH